ncbi:hypothetical protein SEA_ROSAASANTEWAA_6 [Streptomyces phage RosaAsantewaa]|nr:hypothetical protein SEA_ROSAASANTEWAA_6 [Streptomyces phage RosaAsantewaa]
MDGPERPGSVTHLDEVLAHYGVKGMKWGVRRSRSQIDKPPASDDAKSAAATRKKLKEGGTSSLSNQELKAYLERMDLVKRYNASKPPTVKDEVRKFVKDTLINIGKQEAAKYAAKQVGKTLAGRG